MSNNEQRLTGDDLAAALKAMQEAAGLAPAEEAVAEQPESPSELDFAAEQSQELDLNPSEVGSNAEADERSEFENSEQEMSDIEAKARKMGWRPQDEYSDDPEDFVSAEEFVARAPFIKQIHKLKDEIRKQSDGMKSLAQTVKQAEERGRQKALAELQAQKEAAYRQGNYEQARALEQQQDELKGPVAADAGQESAPAQDTSPVADMIINSEIYQNYLAKSAWVNGTSAEDLSKKYAAQQAAEFYINNVGEQNFNHGHIAEMIKFVDAQVNPKKQPAPNPNRAKAPAVANSNVSKKSVSDGGDANHPIHPDYSKLGDAAKLIIRQCFMDAQGKVSDREGLNAYVNELKQNGTIK